MPPPAGSRGRAPPAPRRRPPLRAAGIHHTPHSHTDLSAACPAHGRGLCLHPLAREVRPLPHHGPAPISALRGYTTRPIRTQTYRRLAQPTAAGYASTRWLERSGPSRTTAPPPSPRCGDTPHAPFAHRLLGGLPSPRPRAMPPPAGSRGRAPPAPRPRRHLRAAGIHHTPHSHTDFSAACPAHGRGLCLHPLAREVGPLPHHGPAAISALRGYTTRPIRTQTSRRLAQPTAAG